MFKKKFCLFFYLSFTLFPSLIKHNEQREPSVKTLRFPALPQNKNETFALTVKIVTSDSNLSEMKNGVSQTFCFCVSVENYKNVKKDKN